LLKLAKGENMTGIDKTCPIEDKKTSKKKAEYSAFFPISSIRATAFG
jgi:hypothetical protein